MKLLLCRPASVLGVSLLAAAIGTPGVEAQAVPPAPITTTPLEAPNATASKGWTRYQWGQVAPSLAQEGLFYAVINPDKRPRTYMESFNPFHTRSNSPRGFLFREVVSDLARLEGKIAIFDERCPDTELLPVESSEKNMSSGRIEVMGTMDEIIAKLTKQTPYIIQGHTKESRLFLPSEAYLKLSPADKQVLAALNDTPAERPKNIMPGVPSFEFNGTRVYHIPVVPKPTEAEARETNAKEANSPASPPPAPSSVYSGARYSGVRTN